MGPADALRFWSQVGVLLVGLAITALLLRFLLTPLERRLNRMPMLIRTSIIVVAMAVSVLMVLHLARSF